MTDPHSPPESAPAKPVWTTPVFEDAGNIREAQGGGEPGNDTYNAPAALS